MRSKNPGSKGEVWEGEAPSEPGSTQESGSDGASPSQPRSPAQPGLPSRGDLASRGGSDGASPSQTEPPSQTRSPSHGEIRRRPVHGVYPERDKPTIVFLTVCTKDRRPWLAADDVHRRLVDVWTDAAAWIVGRYVVMPDHVHLFAAPGEKCLPFDNWVKYWKSQFAMDKSAVFGQFQADHWTLAFDPMKATLKNGRMCIIIRFARSL